jgi:iron complex outermembrane receptor protein
LWLQRHYALRQVGENIVIRIERARRSTAALAGSLLLSGMLINATAWSQDSASDAVIDEITVTARHRAENIQSVPISMSAVTGAAIQEGRINTLQGLEYSVPNLVFGETGTSGETHIGIRGIGDFSRNIGFDTRVGVYIDGVFAGQSLAVDQGLVDLAQVEVLRGPQGTLFGKNSSSGAINIVSNKPELGETSGELRLGFGNFDTTMGQAVFNVPLGETAAARFSVFTQEQDGYIKNLFTGKNNMSSDHTIGRLRLRVQPNDNLDINFSYDFRSQDNDLLFLEPDASFENTAGNPEAAPRFVADQDADLIDENSGSGGGLTIDYTLDNGHVLTSISGFRTVDRKVGSDEDATRLFTLDARYFEDDFDHFTQEIRLASPEDQAFRYVVGAFYFDQNADTDRKVALGPGFGGPPEGVDAAIQDSAVDTSNIAVFVNGNVDLADRWTLSGGLRYTDEEKDATIDQFVFPGFGLAELIQESFNRDEDYVTATLNLQFQATDDVLTYFTYSNGYKAGGFNVDLVPTIEDLFFEEETVDSFELGVKSDLLDGRLRLNVTAFQAEYDDYQVFQFRFDPFSNTTALLVSNAASVTTTGVEIEGVARFTDNFELAYGLGFTDAEFDDFPGGAADTNGDPVNVRGNTLPRAPDLTASLTARYGFTAGSVDGSASLNYTHRGEQFFNPDNRENSRQGAYSLLNASLDLDINENWSVGIWGQNLTDEVYRGMRGVSFLGIPFSLYMQPRTYGVEAAYQF